jgi:reductive dehalogenase
MGRTSLTSAISHATLFNVIGTMKKRAFPNKRVDERDTMFARMARREGTKSYEDYYSLRWELKKTDDHIRKTPGLCQPGGRYYHAEISSQAYRYFEDIYEIKPDDKIVEEWKAKLAQSANPTSTLKELVLTLGAVAVGCTELLPEYIYTHKGRLDEDYGNPVLLDHPRIIVFLVEMDFDEMKRAPQAETLRESARQYYRGAVVSKNVEGILKASGFKAKSHHDAHYDVILPPLAVQAGLGELGRNNILIAHHYGSRVRLGGVSTDMTLESDSPIDLGADHFCAVCKKCARNCPSHALSMNGREEIRGVSKWPTNVERCYSYWRAVGTDCGICMATCPFSHRNNLFHNLVRWMIRTAPWTHRTALFFDDLIYGSRWKPIKRQPANSR